MPTIQELDRRIADRLRAARAPLIAALTEAARGRPWHYLLFGSMARGTPRRGSDADIAVVAAGDAWVAAEAAASEICASLGLKGDILQDAYSTFEQAALYILKISDEIRPDGERWHEQLLLTVTAASDSRPAFAPHLWKPLQQLRRLRHVAMDAYLDFEMRQADHTVEAARRLLAKLPPAFDAFGRAFGLLPPQRE